MIEILLPSATGRNTLNALSYGCNWTGRKPLTRNMSILAAPKNAKTREMSYKAFLDWMDEDTHSEWVDGEVLPGLWLRPEWLWEAENLDALTYLLENELIAEALRVRMNKEDNA